MIGQIFTFYAVREDTFHFSSDSGFFVGSFRLLEDISDFKKGDLIKLIGTSAEFYKAASDGTTLEIEARIEVDRFSNGENAVAFRMISWDLPLPNTEDAMVAFLSKYIDGIGESSAKTIVNTFGVHNIESIFMFHPERLLEVRGITPISLEKIKQSWATEHQKLSVTRMLKRAGMSGENANLVFNHLTPEECKQGLENPYIFCKVPNFPLKAADLIAVRKKIIGWRNMPSRRMSCLKESILNLHGRTTHTLFPISSLVYEAHRLSGIAEKTIQGDINYLLNHGHLFKVPFQDSVNKIMSRSAAKVEMEVYWMLKTIATTPSHRIAFSQDEIQKFCAQEAGRLDKSQMASFTMAMSRKVSVIAGSPGTGKTHTAKSILSAYTQKGYSIACVAPTGKAAQRLYELTGVRASTIHRLLNLLPKSNPERGAATFEEVKDAGYLDIDLIVVDESSMPEIYLIHALLKAIDPYRTALLFIGDECQLPPVGMGNFFRDTVKNCDFINIAVLQEIHRTEANNDIYLFAQAIRNGVGGKFPLKNNIKESNVVFFEVPNEEIETNIEQQVIELLRRYDPRDIQVLSPRNESEASVSSLNTILRPHLNPYLNSGRIYPEHGITSNGRVYNIGDRVVQLQNNYDLNIFNGDTGEIIAIDERENTATVLFNKAHEVELKRSDLFNINYAYCTTIHKAQGSDFPVTIIPLSPLHAEQWTRALVYTGVSRAKKELYLIGNRNLLINALDKVKDVERNTFLQELYRLDKNRQLDKVKNVSMSLLSST